MRDAFIEELTKLAGSNSQLMLMTGDLGYGVIEGFQERFPSQFVNAGVAEQNMTGVAAGLASQGFSVVLYSITNFVSFRNLEQIRNDICYHSLPVTIVGVGAGFSYGSLGYSHHGIEDVSVVRALPNIEIVNPLDESEARVAAHLPIVKEGPRYIRLAREPGRPVAKFAGAPSDFGPPRIHRNGDQLSILTTGPIVSNVLDAADDLSKRGVECSVYTFPVLKPIDPSWLSGIPLDTPILCVEEHTLDGGFGAIVLETFNKLGLSVPVKTLGAKNQLQRLVGDQAFLRHAHGLDACGIAESALAFLRAAG